MYLPTERAVEGAGVHLLLLSPHLLFADSQDDQV